MILAIEVTEENFEGLLANDDVLLDYFNAFLRLPVSALLDVAWDVGSTNVFV